jgi:hypothetical protein
VHEQQTVAGMPGFAAPQAAPAPQQPPASAAYGYPAQPGPEGYGYPGPPPAAQGFGYPGYSGYPPSAYPSAYLPPPRNGFGVTALVLGIIAVVGCITSFLAIAIGIAAIVFGALGQGRAKRGEATNGGMALAGIILGAIGVLLGAAVLAIGIVGIMEDAGKDGPRRGPSSSNSRFHERI